MNTNSWEEIAQQSLDDADRRHIERGRLRSRRVVRAASAAVATGAVVTTALLTAGTAANDGVPLWVVGGAVASTAVLVTGLLTIVTDRRARTFGARSSALDERELALHLAARADAYRWALLVVGVLTIAALMALNADRRDARGDDTFVRAVLYALLVFGCAVMPALPHVLHLLRSPDPADD